MTLPAPTPPAAGAGTATPDLAALTAAPAPLLPALQVLEASLTTLVH